MKGDVGALNGIDNSWLRGKGATSSGSVDTLVEPGIYALDNSIQQIGDGGLIIVFDAGLGIAYKGQLVLGTKGLYSRVRTTPGDFTGIDWNIGG